MVAQWRAVCVAVDEPPEELAACLDALAPVANINLVGGRANAWAGGKAERDDIKDAFKALRGLWREEEPLVSLCLGPQDDLLAALIPLLATLFEDARRIYAARKDEAQALDYDDLERLTLDLLRAHPEVRERWRGDVGALLVDEFQDTNGRQLEIVELLDGDRQRRFVVGDAKQSIYRFRGADVTVFRGMQEAVGPDRLFPLDTS